jgi:hypothetical protein
VLTGIKLPVSVSPKKKGSSLYKHDYPCYAFAKSGHASEEKGRVESRYYPVLYS